MAGPLPAEYTPVRPSPSHIFKQLRSVARPIPAGRQAGKPPFQTAAQAAAKDFRVARAVYPRLGSHHGVFGVVRNHAAVQQGYQGVAARHEEFTDTARGKPFVGQPVGIARRRAEQAA